MSDTNQIENQSAAPETQLKKPKMKLWKKILLGVLIALVLIIILLILLLDILVEKAVPKVAGMALGTEMKIADFNSSLSGKVELKGLSIANPEGFSDNPAFELETVYISLDTASLFGNEIVINEILVSGMTVNVEFDLLGGRTNLGTLQENLERNLPAPAPAEEESEPEKAQEDESEPKKVIIDKLTIENNQIILANVPIILAPIRMTEIGRGQSLSETVNDVFGAVVKATLETAGSAAGAVTKGLQDLSSGVTDTLSESGKALQETTGKILDIFTK